MDDDEERTLKTLAARAAGEALMRIGAKQKLEANQGRTQSAEDDALKGLNDSPSSESGD